jgi:L-lactate utilization protein LutB
MTFSKTYQQVNLINENDKKILEVHEGNQQFKEMVKLAKESSIERQPLYYEEVDHHIEEVGIMAIK